MAFERKDLVQDVATSTGTAAFMMAGTPPQGMQAFGVHTIGATFRYRAFAGAQWELGTGTWNGTTIARSVRKSSNADALVNFTTAPTVMEVVDAADVSAFLTAADGVDVASLTNITPTTAHKVLLIDPSTGQTYTVLVSALLALSSGGTGGTAAAQIITVNTPTTQTVGVSYTASGTYTNGTPAALDFSVDGGATWSAAPSPTIAGGNWSFTATPSTASAGRQMMVRDHTTLVSGTSGTYVVNAAATQAITVATPATQTVGTAFNVTGTYANGTPAALDYRLSDDAAGVWTQVATATISGGAFSFSVTPATASVGRTISVRDRTTQVSGTSGTYVVNAAAAPSTNYNVTLVTAASPGFPTAQSAGWTSGEAPVGVGAPVINIKASDGSVPSDATNLKFVIGAHPDVPPIAYTDTSVPGSSGTPGETGNTSARSNSVIAGTGSIAKAGTWTLGSDPNGGNFKPNTGNFYVWTSPTFPRNFYLWVLMPNGFAKPVRDTQGNPVAWNVTQ